MSVDEVFDAIESTLRELSEKLGNVDIIIISTSGGHPISYHSSESIDENFVMDLSALLGSMGEGIKVVLEELKIRYKGGEELIFLETKEHIFIMSLLEKATMAIQIRKPALLGTVRAIVKSYIPRINALLSKLEEAQMRAIREEIVKEIAPISVQ